MRACLLISTCCLMLLFSCKKEEKPRRGISASPVVSVLSTRVVAYAAKTMTFDIDFILAGNLPLDFYTLEPASVLFFNSSDGNYSLKADSTFTLGNNTSFSNALLIDQSGTYDSDDTLNFRFEAFNVSYEDFSGSDYLSLSACASGGRLETDILTVYDDFKPGYDESVLNHFLDLTQKTGGQSCIYDALYKLTAYTAANAPTASRSITALVHQADQASVHTAAEVISYANSQQVKVNIIWLGKDGFDGRQMTQIPACTGGATVYCPSVDYLPTAFEVVNSSMKENLLVNRVRIKYIKTDPGNFHAGVEFIHYFCPWGNRLLPYLWFYIKF